MSDLRLATLFLSSLLCAAPAAQSAPLDEILAAGGERADLDARGMRALFDDLDGDLLGLRGFALDFETAVARDLGDLGGAAMTAAAHASTRAGQVVGESAVAGGTHAFVWDAATGMTDLGDLPGGPVAAVARAVNQAGQVVGQGQTDAGPRAFLWQAEMGMVDLNDLVDPADGLVLVDARTIDASGRIAGTAQSADGLRAFVWDPESGLLDLAAGGPGDGSLHFVEARAFGGDRLAGRALSADGQDRPVLWGPGDGLVDLGSLPGGVVSGRTNAINGAGQAVGGITTRDGDRAFLWDEVAGTVDLNDLILAYEGTTLVAAVDIDEAGRILAYGLQSSEVHFFVLDPEADALAEAAGIDVADLGMGYDKGLGAGGYTLIDLGQFLTSLDTPPVLSMDEAGRIVGGCDPLAPACPYLPEDFELVTNLIDDGIPDFLEPFPDNGPTTLVGFPSNPGGGPSSPDGQTTRSLPTFPHSTGGGFGSVGSGGGNDGPEPNGPDPDGTPHGPEIPSVPLPPAGMGLLVALGLLGRYRRRSSPA